MEYYTGVLKKYAVFQGRARRREFWMFCVFSIIISFVLSIIGSILGTKTGNAVLGFLVLFYSLAIFIPSLAVTVRRLHDTNHSGWWWFISLIPAIGAILLLVFLFTDSTPGDNKYGPNPKGISTPTVSSVA